MAKLTNANVLQAISGFMSSLRSTDFLHINRALLALLNIVKELASARLQLSRRQLQAATPEIIAVVGDLYAQSVDRWRNGEIAHRALSTLAVELLGRLMIVGYEHPNRDPTAISFWKLSLQHLAAFMPLLSSISPDTPTMFDEVGEHVVQLAKLHHEMPRTHPAAFILLPNSLELSLAYWNFIKDVGKDFGSKAIISSDSEREEGSQAKKKAITETIALKGLLIIRACVKMVHNPAQNFKIRTPEDKEEKAHATSIIRETMLTESFVREVMNTLVTHFFVFRSSDLREWQDDPEEWEKREEGEGDDWEFSVRSCSEKLFLDLAINYKEIVMQPLLEVFYSVAKPDYEDIMFKDSVYTAIGLAAPVVQEHIDFDAFIRDVLVLDVQNDKPGCFVLRRRVSILLGQWISIKISQTSRPLVYEIFQHLFKKEDALNDEVVRISAGRQLANIVNDWDFEADRFLPYAETILTKVMQLVEEVASTDTKMALLNTLSVVVERLDSKITPFAQRIILLLPPLWEIAEEEPLMKANLVTILTRLVNAMRADSLPMHSWVYPIIKGAVEAGSETAIYLIEEALELWGAILAQTPSEAVSPDLLDLVRFLYPIYQLGSENLRKALEITESYLILAPQYMLSIEVRTPLFVALSDLFEGLRPEANGLVCNLVEMMLRMSSLPDAAANLPLGEHNNAAASLITDLARTRDSADDVGLIPKLLRGLHGSYLAHCVTGPNAQDPAVDGIVETDYFSILARAINGSLEGFLYTVKECSNGESLEDTMKWLLAEWYDHYQNIGDPSRRKLMCMAMTKLLETNQPFILLNLQQLMSMWTDVVTELREDEADTHGDSLVFADGAVVTSDATESPEDARRRVLSARDDVHTINLTEFIKHYLQQAIAAAGGWESFQEQWLVNVDKEVVDGFSKLGIV